MSKTRARAEDLCARGHTAYWIVLSYQDGLDLLADVVPAGVRQQLVPVIKRRRDESAREYAARIAQATRRHRMAS